MEAVIGAILLLSALTLLCYLLYHRGYDIGWRKAWRQISERLEEKDKTISLLSKKNQELTWELARRDMEKEFEKFPLARYPSRWIN